MQQAISVVLYVCGSLHLQDVII